MSVEAVAAVGALLSLAPVAGADRPVGAVSDGDCAALARGFALLKDDWQYTCLRLEGDRQLIAGMPEPGDDDGDEATGVSLPMRLWSVSPRGVVWERQVSLVAGMGREVAAALDRAEQWSLAMVTAAYGGRPGLRVSAKLRWGEDYTFVREIALLFALAADDTPARLLWAGAGDLVEDRLGVCKLAALARFRLVNDSVLERRYQVSRTLPRPQVAPEVARSLRRRCVIRPLAASRFAVGGPVEAPVQAGAPPP